MFLQKKIFRLTQFIYFYLVVEAQGTLNWLKLYIKLYQQNYFFILKNQITHVFSFLGPTGISAVNIGGTTIHSGRGIKPGVKLLGLSDKMKASLRNTLSEVKMVIIDEFSMV